MREIRMLRSTRRGLETWHGRDDVTLAAVRPFLRQQVVHAFDSCRPSGQASFCRLVCAIASRLPK